MDAAQEKPLRTATPRMSITLHEQLKRLAEARGISLNRYMVAALKAQVLRDEEPEVADLGGRPWG
jgi:predicted HicB family RNase H-like nuclease